MDTISNGLISIANGIIDLAGKVVSPISVIVVILVVSYSWLCLIELDELDRQATKPEIGRH